MKGQAMLIVVLTLSALLGMSTALSGLLVAYELRQTAGLTQSAVAIYAADSGIEYELYRKYKNVDYPAPVFHNSASVRTSATPASIRSVGQSGSAARAFEYTF